MRPLSINVDMDGVVYDFTEAFARLTPDLELDQTKWDLGLGLRTFNARFDEAILNGVFLVGHPIEGALEGLAELVGAGHRVRLVTAKQMQTSYLSYVAQEGTLKWLDRRQLLHQVEVVFSDHAKQGYPADVVIDDHPGLGWAQRFAHNIIFDQPWNQGVDLRDRPSVSRWRAKGWEAVMAVIDGLTEEAAS